MNLAPVSQPALSHTGIYRQRRAMGIYPRPRFVFKKGDLERLYLDEKKSLKEIGDLLGCHRDTITDWLRYFKIPIRTVSEGYRLAVQQGRVRSPGIRGNKHNWKGKKIVVKGYVYVYRPGHPRANKSNRVLEHILVWEAIHRQPLPQGWIIHHLNGDKLDNHSGNLAASPSRNHYEFILALTSRIKSLEQEVERIKNEQAAGSAA